MGTNKKKEGNVVFLNITIVDASLAVKEKVKGKLEKLPKPVQNQAAHAATYFTGRRKTAQILSQRFRRELPARFARKGVTIAVEEVFREGPYVVLKLTVLNVDSQAIDRNWLRWFTRNIGFREKIEENLLPNLVTKHLRETMPKLLDERMTQSKITAETKVNIPSKQEEYFQMKMEELSNEIEARRQNKSLRKIRKRLSLSNVGDSRKEVDEERQPQNDEQSVTSEPNNLRAKLKQRWSGISLRSSLSADEGEERQSQNDEHSVASEPNNLRAKLKNKLSGISLKSSFSADEGNKENTKVLDPIEDDTPVFSHNFWL